MPQNMPTVQYAEIVGRVVRLHRTAHQIPLATFAKTMGVTLSGWSRVETGDSTMRVDQLSRAATALKTAPHVLVAEADALYRSVTGKKSEGLTGP
jgi:transcriptional regulator with XRE-family HTH domain